MTVGELRKILEGCNDDSLTVVVEGYEDGAAEAEEAKVIKVIPNEHGEKDGIYGRHGLYPAEKCTKKMFYIGEEIRPTGGT